MTTYARDLQAINLSIFGIQVNGAGTDGFLRVTTPKFIEHVDGQGGDAVHYKTGLKTATFQLTVLQDHQINIDLIGVINTAKLDSEANGQGEFLLKDLNSGMTITGDCTLDGYPDEIPVNAEESNLVYSGRIYNIDVKFADRATQ
jgi:hypothetical protein